MSSIFSTKKELKEMSEYLTGYLKLPFSEDSIPGHVMENIVATAKQAEMLKTYDFADVIDRDKKLGWQVKSTKENTPLTWKRVKLPNAQNLIENSFKSSKNIQFLGDSIIDFCNKNAEQSILDFNLDKLGFSRVIFHPNGTLTYFERLLCTKKDPIIFKKEDFIWKWSTKKNNQKKESLKALHGFHKETGIKWFAWHGLGENQLHFSGEKEWWPENKRHMIHFKSPKEKHSMEILKEL